MWGWGSSPPPFQPSLGGRFGFFFLFGSGVGKREEASEQVAGSRFFIENKEGLGGVSEEARWCTGAVRKSAGSRGEES